MEYNIHRRMRREDYVDSRGWKARDICLDEPLVTDVHNLEAEGGWDDLVWLLARCLDLFSPRRLMFVFGSPFFWALGVSTIPTIYRDGRGRGKLGITDDGSGLFHKRSFHC